jgi:hypothetical protein
MSWLFEQPLVIVFLGVAAALAFGALWSTTGRKGFLIAALAALALLVAGLVVEKLVVTDNEAIRATLQEIARDVRTNNHQALLAHIDASAPELKQKAKSELPNYKFADCRITRVNLVDVDASSEPRSAIAEFNVVATGTFRYEGTELTDTIPRWIKLQFVKDKDGRWRVIHYEHDDPQRMLMNRDGR